MPIDYRLLGQLTGCPTAAITYDIGLEKFMDANVGAEMFDSLSIPSMYIGTAVFILLSFEAGHQIGRYTLSHSRNTVDTAPGPMVGSILATLAFVLAFTFNMAASRFDLRKQNVLTETIVINTAYMQADFLDQPHKSEMQRVLREYVDVRLRGLEPGNRENALTKSHELQQILWNQVASVARQNPNIFSARLVQSVLDIISIHEKRLTAATRNRIPRSIWFTLYAISAFAMLAMGSQTGLARTRRLIQVIPLVLVFSALMTLVADLDRPAELGLIKVSQEAMISLQESMDRARP